MLRATGSGFLSLSLSPRHRSLKKHTLVAPLARSQVQDDYLDCYGDPERIGKIGTDIRDNKCSWLINCALKDCTSAQRRTLEANYAKKDPKCEAKVHMRSQAEQRSQAHSPKAESKS